VATNLKRDCKIGSGNISSQEHKTIRVINHFSIIKSIAETIANHKMKPEFTTALEQRKSNEMLKKSAVR
jgi:hypothetical protein